MPNVMLTLQRWSLLLLWLVYSVSEQTGDSCCPAADAGCRCYDNSIVCADLGQRIPMPAFNNCSREYSLLSFQGDTRILRIQSRAFAGLRVKRIDLSGLGLAFVDQYAFTDVDASVLREFILADNLLQTLPWTVFADMTSLTLLNLSFNQLSDLPTSALTPLTRLQTLDLSHNFLRRLPDGIFANRTTLVNVNLSGNNLTVTTGTFRGMTSVRELLLSENSICAISSSFFQGLNQIRLLDLSDNKIVDMEAGLLSFSTTLKTINLSGNKISDITHGVFHNGPSLIKIDLSRNKIRQINRTCFDNLELHIIDLSHNEIEFIHPGAFGDIAAVTSVFLNHNRLVEVPSELFLNVPLLENVDFDYNLIEKLKSSAFQYLHLTHISLAGNKIRSIHPQTLENLFIKESEPSIDLSGNQIEHIPDKTFNQPGMFGLHGMSALSHLSLSQNRLTEVTSETFTGLSGLVSLDISDNRISTVADEAFSGLTKLRNLRLDGNRLESIKYSWIGDIVTLQTLNLSASGLNDQSLESIRGLSGLTELNLDSNNLTSLKQLPNIMSLNTLSLRNNSLSHIDHNSSSLVSVLDLGQNILRSDTLAASLKPFHNITSLKLDYNRLEVIPRDAFSTFEGRLEELDLSGNGLSLTSLGALLNLSSIRVLTMDNNELQDISSIAASPMTNVVRKLSVKHNRLNSAVFSVLSSFTNLRELLLDSNNIDSIPDRVFQSTCNITVLSLAGNVIQTISNDAFSCLKNLSYLDSSENSLTSINLPPIMTSLRVLLLGGNKLQTFPGGLRYFSRISKLNVSRNSIVVLPRSLTVVGHPRERAAMIDFQQNNLLNCRNLQLIGSFGHVDFSSNNLKDLARIAMARVKYVRRLDLSKNQITVLSPTISQTAYSVSHLNISMNRIGQIVPAATDDKHCGSILRTLDLSYNSLQIIPTGYISSLSSSLTVLDIRSNVFRSLPQTEFNNMTKLTHLFLAGNPWLCDCDLVWIRQLKCVFVDNATCLVPAQTYQDLVLLYTPMNTSNCPLEQPWNDTRCPIAPRLTIDMSTSSVTATSASYEDIQGT